MKITRSLSQVDLKMNLYIDKDYLTRDSQMCRYNRVVIAVLNLIYTYKKLSKTRSGGCKEPMLR